MLARVGVKEPRGERDGGSAPAHSRPFPPVALVSKGRRSITSTVGFRPTTPLCQAVGANRAEPWSAPPSRWTVGILDPNWTVWAVTAPAWFRRYSGEHADWKLGQTWGQTGRTPVSSRP